MNSDRATYTGFEFQVEGHQAMAIINADLKDIDRSKYNYSVFINITPDSYNEYGHPVGEEFDYLNEIEKSIIEYLEQQTQTVHVGHTTIYRAREIIFYTKEDLAVQNFLEHFLPATERTASFDIEEDPEWNNVSAFYELL